MVNQTVLTPKGAEFQEIDGIVPGSEDFNRVYGDSYISGALQLSFSYHALALSNPIDRISNIIWVLRFP